MDDLTQHAGSIFVAAHFSCEALNLKDQYDHIYRATLAKWGEEAQYDQAVEECAELITALKHFKRDKVGLDHVIDELADVALMVGQLSYMLGEDRVRQAVRNKLAKLERLLAGNGK